MRNLSKNQKYVLNAMNLTSSQRSELAYRWSKEQWIALPVWRYIHLLSTASFTTSFVATHVHSLHELEGLYTPTLYAFMGIVLLGLIEFLGIGMLSIPTDMYNKKYQEYLSYTSCRSAVMTYIDILIVILHIVIAIFSWQYSFAVCVFPISYLMSFAFYKQRQRSMVYEAIAKLL